MTSEKRRRKVVELLTPQADSLQLFTGAPGLEASVIRTDTEGSPGPLRLLERSTSPETARQMVENIAGFFSQVATWDAQQTLERRAA
jgi:hypothetical protein